MAEAAQEMIFRLITQLSTLRTWLSLKGKVLIRSKAKGLDRFSPTELPAQALLMIGANAREHRLHSTRVL
ncbi:hypothetical protein CCACVL1_18472 [Corchorus capsularis]|uniref:Uncharacterized protein n=1 Tax=Corchorus capsularis TaxID=210143 RepID=A0A1R3HL03_COCAP|nr:hypothetical protein CCACVL1_18472 [Corchorus capsularis]